GTQAVVQRLRIVAERRLRRRGGGRRRARRIEQLHRSGTSRQRIQRFRRRGRVLHVVPEQLALEHLRDAEAIAAVRERHRELRVGKIAVLLGLLGIEDAGAEARAPHRLQHHLREQRFELARDRRGRRALVHARGRLQPRQCSEVGEVAGRARIERHRQITTSSACSAPASRSACRIDTRSLGDAPTWFTARTISSRFAPVPNLNMCPPCSVTCTELCGTTAVWPRLYGSGWLTVGVSVIETSIEPCATAAGVTRTFEPITTVPVRELTITRAGASPGATSRSCTAPRKPTRAFGSTGERSTTVTASAARAVPSPNVLLIAVATREAVMKSGVWRLRARSP